MKDSSVKILRVFIIILLALNMTLIFYFSSQVADDSDKTSSEVIVRLVKMIYKDYDSRSEQEQYEIVQSYQFVVRKIAHMTEYAALGVLSCAFALTYGLKFKNTALSFLFCVLYSGSDEIHQLFVEGRSCQLTDVFIDSGGALIGTVCFVLVTLFFVKIKKSLKEKKSDGS